MNGEPAPSASRLLLRDEDALMNEGVVAPTRAMVSQGRVRASGARIGHLDQCNHQTI